MCIKRDYAAVVILVVVLVLATLGAGYADTVVFEGVPVMKTTSSLKSTVSEPLKDDDQIAYGLVITKKGKNYFWSSRGDKKLIYTRTELFHYFLDPEEGGYIKITTAEDNKYIYIEHFTRGLLTMTYWGGGRAFKP